MKGECLSLGAWSQDAWRHRAGACLVPVKVGSLRPGPGSGLRRSLGICLTSNNVVYSLIRLLTSILMH